MRAPHTPPTYQSSAFNCPYCGVYAAQEWSDLTRPSGSVVNGLQLALCSHCGKHTVWIDGRLLLPVAASAPMPNDDLSHEIKDDYEEARRIVTKSPRGAAALLRLCVQRLCQQLGEEGKDLNTDIGNLVAKGLPERVQRALEVVRVVGNNAVHPGQMDLKDDQQTAMTLFELVNVIAERMITQPKRIDAIFQALPQMSRRAIEDGDERAKKP